MKINLGAGPNWKHDGWHVLDYKVEKNDKFRIKGDLNKINLSIGEYKILEKGEISKDYNEILLKEFMRNEKLDIKVDLKMGTKKFTAYTMDLTKKYIEINADYRS